MLTPLQEMALRGTCGKHIHYRIKLLTSIMGQPSPQPCHHLNDQNGGKSCTAVAGGSGTGV